MLRKCSRTLFLLLVVLVPVFLLGTGSGRADEGDNGGAVRLLMTIPIPGTPMTAFDISWVDSDSELYYLADRSNAAIDVIDAKKGTFVRQIHGNPGPFKGFTGNNDTSGPNGVVVSGRWLFVTDAPSRVVTIDLTTDKIVSDVSTGGAPGLRADELAYDSKDGLLLVVNNADSPPFASLITVDKGNGHLTADPKPCGTPPCRITFTTATNGAEQPVWDRGTGRFYMSIPEVGGVVSNGAVARINPNGALETLFPVQFCQPAGLTIGPREDLLLGCSVVFDTAGVPWTAADTKTAAPIQIIMDAKTGAIDKRVAGVGGSDEVWFNPGNGRYYTGSRNNPTGPVLGVIDAKSQTLIQVIPTVNKAPGSAHSVAVNPHNDLAFVPLPANNVFPSCLNGCVAVFGTPEE
jgi:hypothetical protein